MNIFSFKKMRAYRSDGKIIAILSAVLPRCEGEGMVCERFNSFYCAVFDRYSRTCEQIKKSDGGKILKISVEYRLLEGATSKMRKKDTEGLIIIQRTTVVSDENGRAKSEATDVFDVSRGIFIR